MKCAVLKINPHRPDGTMIQRAAAVLRAGGLVAFPTETVYGLGANALDPKAVCKIFAVKKRPGWDPLIVHVRDVAMARSLAKRLPATFDLLAAKFWPGPLTLVVEKAGHVPDEVTADRSTIALRIPQHRVAMTLLAEVDLPVAAPSANRFGRPSPTHAEHVVEDLGDRIDLILDAGPTPVGVESTVLDLTQSPPAILRPGGVSREELQKVLGKVTLASSISDELAAKGLAGPGMTHKHYAPRANVELFDNETALEKRAKELRVAHRRVAELREPRPETLFAKLRELDADGTDVILCVLPAADGIGLAVRDRLLRAAGRGGPS